jgi:hypothetical protein
MNTAPVLATTSTVADEKPGPSGEPCAGARAGRRVAGHAVSVELPFQPEYYHVHKLQEIGTVAGVQGRKVRVLQLSADQVREIASFYWVERVDVS